MTALVIPSLRQINLYNPALIPTREIFSARLIVIWVVVAAVAMAAVAWWAIVETHRVSREVSNQAAYQASEKARSAPTAAGGEPIPTPQQMAAREQTLRNQQAMLEVRRAARDTLKRGLADDKGGPSALMRLIANTVPPQAWLTEFRAEGNQFEIVGKTLDPVTVNVWLERLRASGYLAAKPVPTVRLERFDPPAPTPARDVPVYTFGIIAALASPFAEDGGRP